MNATAPPSPSERLLDVVGLEKRYTSSGTLAIESVTLDVRPREFVSIVGPSGCGKTTLLKTICGLLHPRAGSVTLNGARVTTPPPEMVLVFQDYARSLFPWLTVAGNVAFPLRKKRLAPDARARVVDDALDAVGLAKFAKHYPWQLSGGMQQRVAIARAIAFRPEILLLDEPFASVDALTRADLEDLTLRLRAELGITMLLVTHDIDEAVYLSDRVFVLSTPPSHVVREVAIPLGQPRDQERTRSDARFLALRNELHHLIGRRRETPAAPLAEALR
ncbi:MAG: ABC transporter ATP-binding protein [Candidatus Eremiobacteraeota bacterium]|nr:ABC transporter ATP-binding protein [Candidatus Eremiobacteraeota bacterium]